MTNDTVSDQVWPIIANTEALAVSKAWAGESGTVFKAASETIVLGKGTPEAVPAWQWFSKKIDAKSTAVLLMNHAATPVSWTLNFADVPGLDGTTSYKLRDINAHADVGPVSGSVPVNNVASHDAPFWIITPA